MNTLTDALPYPHMHKHSHFFLGEPKLGAQM